MAAKKTSKKVTKKRKPVAKTSVDLTGRSVAGLKELFPETVANGKVDFDKLRQTLGDEVDDRPDRYSFTWAGKQQAIRLLQLPTRATLIPAPRESVNFDNSQHIFIEGDNLEVMKLLYKAYSGRVKMIYIDPPYNTGNDFIYRDNYTAPLDSYLQLTRQKDAQGNLLTSNPETGGRYHSAWLSMMYPRLFVARQLLREDGAVFISIDDHEMYNLRLMMNEVFGEENFVATVIWQRVYSPKSSARHFSVDHDYILIYARNAETWSPRLLPRTAEMDARYGNRDQDPRGPWKSSDLGARNYYSLGIYPISCPSGRIIQGPPSGSYWRVSEDKFRELDKDSRIWWGEDGNSVPAIKRFLSEVKPGKVPQTLWTYDQVGHTQEAKKELLQFVQFEHTSNVLNTVKPTRLIRRMLQVATNPASGDVVLDFFAGSAATAHAVLAQNLSDGGNRQFIMVQLPEQLPKPEATMKTIFDMGTERIHSVLAGIRKDRGGDDQEKELGFRVFKLTESHFRLWEGTDKKNPEDYAKTMEMFADPLLPKWKVKNVIYEVAIKEGYGLNSRMKKLKGVERNSVWKVTDAENDQSFFISLDKKIYARTPKDVGLSEADLFVCRDIALTDKLAANLALQCQLKTI